MELPNLGRWRRPVGCIDTDNWPANNVLTQTQQHPSNTTGPQTCPPASAGAQYPMAHIGPEYLDSESLRILHELYRALRPWPDAKHAVRVRLNGLLKGVQDDAA